MERRSPDTDLHNSRNYKSLESGDRFHENISQLSLGRLFTPSPK